MGDDSTPPPEVHQFLRVLGSAPAFDVQQYFNRLHGAVLSAPSMSKISKYFTLPEEYKAAPQDNCHFGGVDCTSKIDDLAFATLGAIMSILGKERGYKDIVDLPAAAKVRDSTLLELMPYFFLDHLNTALGSESPNSTLQACHKNSTLTTGFKETVCSPDLRLSAYAEDTDRLVQIILFVLEFFESPDIPMPKDPAQLKSKAAMQTWIKTITAHVENPEAERQDWMALQVLISAAGMLGFASTGVFNPTGLASATLSEHLTSLQKADLLFQGQSEIIKQIIKSVLEGTLVKDDTENQFEGHAYKFHQAWEAEIDDKFPANMWKEGWQKLAADVESTSSGATSGDPLKETIKQWLDDNRSNTKLGGISQFENPRGPPDLGCFSPTTKVLTSPGAEVGIDKLFEGCSVLTRAEPEQYGSCSSEMVINPAPTYLYGLNSEGVFFTSGHPFYTTTGLRAVDPVIAQEENPWLDVGTLKVGHQLLRTMDGKTYEPVLVQSIECEKATHPYVYGVHLREGLRSYHANGYLVALNYPEITITSIGQAIASLPTETRLQLVPGLKQIAPLLERLGGSRLLDVLVEAAARKDSGLQDAIEEKTELDTTSATMEATKA